MIWRGPARAVLALALLACEGASDDTGDAALRLPEDAARADGGSAPDASGAGMDGGASVRWGRPLDDAERRTLLGDDRVGDALAAIDPAAWPQDWEGVEALLGIGRACGRATQEIFIVEDARTRRGGRISDTSLPVPRTVVTGCGEREQDRTALFAVLSTDPTLATTEDPLASFPVELMARDRRTGRYNFYELLPAPSGRGALLVRVDLDEEGRARAHARPADGRRTRDDTRATCFGCHLHGAPLFNEIARPWTGWISEFEPLSQRRYGGLTADLAGQTERALGARPTRAYDLETSMRFALDAFVAGTPDRPGLLDEWLARGSDEQVARALACETELNHEARPLSLFVDPDAVAGTTIVTPGIPDEVELPRLVPTRSVFDRTIERVLVERGLLRAETALALRLVDLDRDVFSEARCGRVGSIVSALGAGRSLDESVRGAVLEVLPSLEDEPVREYAAALLVRPLDRAALASAREAYLAAVRARVRSRAESLQTDEGRARLEHEAWQRVERAESWLGREGRTPLPRAR